MYLCKIKITAEPADGRAAEAVGNILKSIVLPEDCELTASETPDSAAVIDGDIETLNAAKEKGVLCALILDENELNGMSDEALSLADELFVMPTENRYDERLLSVYISKLITRLKDMSDSRRLSVCLNTAIDSIPDLVWFKDEKGSHLNVNDSFCKAVEKTKRQIYKRGHYYIWDIPQEEYEKGEYVCLESEDIVMEARKTCIFDEKVKTKGGMREFKTYKSPLIDIDGTIIGTCGIAHDVTDLHNINSELNVILESIPFATLVEDEKGIILSVNSRFHELFEDTDAIIGKSYYDWKQQELSGKIIRFNEREEICIEINGEERYLHYGEEPIHDTFGETIGNIGIFSDVTEDRLKERSTIKSANTDFLTGLNNRRGLFGYLSAINTAHQITFISVDLDNFKQVNDNSGHHMGDVALELTAHILQTKFPEDFIARLGGDEFLVVIKRPCYLHDIQNDADDLLKMLKEQFSDHVEFLGLSASAGIFTEKLVNCGKYDFDCMLRLSDRALYKAKNSGKGICCTYDGD